MRKTSRLRQRVACTLAAALCLMALPTVASAAPFKLFVDAGHGGKDPGAVGGSLLEKNSSLKITRLVVKAAKRQGWAVSTSRDSDKYVGLRERAMKANRMKANAFVSIHSNSTGRKNLGNMTIYRTPKGKRLGRGIMRELGQMTPYGDIGNRKDVRGLAVLRYAKMPAVIVEVLSVSAPKERAMLRDADTQQVAAEAIVEGIAKSRGMDYKAPGEDEDAKKSKAKAPARPQKKIEVPRTGTTSATPETTTGIKPVTPRAPQAERNAEKPERQVTKPEANEAEKRTSTPAEPVEQQREPGNRVDGAQVAENTILPTIAMQTAGGLFEAVIKIFIN